MNTVQVLYDDPSTPNGYGLIPGLHNEPNRNAADILFDQSFSVKDKGAVSFDNVKPEYFTIYPIQFLNPSQIDSEKYIEPLLSKKLIELINNKSNKVYLLLFIPSEGLELRWNNYSMLKQLRDFDSRNIVDPTKVLFVYGCLNFKKILSRVYDDQPKLKSRIPHQNFFSYNYFERIASSYIHNKSFKTDRYVIDPKAHLKGRIGNKHIQKHFIYKNGVMRPGRMFTYLFLKVNGLLDKCHYSVLAPEYSFDTFKDKNVMYDFLEGFTIDKKHYYESYLELEKELPITLDLPQDAYSHHNTPVFPDKYTKTTAVEIVVETHIDIDNQDGLNVTEKVFFPMIYRLPFIVLGPPGLYKYLHQKGYSTFPQLFNEDFANEKDYKKRAQMFCTEIERFASRPLQEVQEMVNSKQVQATIKSNHDLLKSQLNEDCKLDLDFFNIFKNNISL